MERHFLRETGLKRVNYELYKQNVLLGFQCIEEVL